MKFPRRGRVKVIGVALLTLVFVLSLAVGALGAKTTQQLTAIFRNIKLVVNGQVLQTAEEPFIINGRTYVPLRVVGEALGAWVDWNENTSVVTIAGRSGNTAALEAQLQQKDIQIAQLQQQLEEAKKGSSTSGTLASLEKDLNRDYAKLKKVGIDDISLSGDKDDVDLEIEVDLDDYEKDWKSLTDKDIKGWVEDICEEIQDYYSDDTYVTGEIIDIDSNSTLVTFNKKGTKSLSITYKDSKFRKGGKLSDLQADLEEDYDELGDVEIEDIILYGDEDDVDVEIEVDLDDYGSEWEDLSDKDIERWLEDICDDIQDFYSEDTEITGEIWDADSGAILVEFDKDGDDDLEVDFKDSAFR